MHLFDFSGSSDGLVAIYDTKNSSGSPRHVSEVVGITSNSGGLSRASTSVVQWFPSDNAVFVSRYHSYITQARVGGERGRKMPIFVYS